MRSCMRKVKDLCKHIIMLAPLLFIASCLNSKDEFDVDKILGSENIVDVMIIGSGPAGLSAAMHGARSRLKTVVIGEDMGQPERTTWVENYPGVFPKVLGPELVKSMKKQAESFGAEFVLDKVTNIDFSSWPYKVETEGGKTFNALTVIVATGVSPRNLNVPGEQEYSHGKGVSSCAICDGPFYTGEDVVVVGGGDSAVEEAIQLANAGVKKVTVLVRSYKMRAIPIMQEHLEGYPNIFVKYNTKVKEILGDGNQVTGVTLYDTIAEEEYLLPVSGVFLAIGSEPNTDLVKDAVDLDARGFILMQERKQKTSLPAVFAAGDLESGRNRQIIIAAAAGVQAGIDAFNFLTEVVGLNTKARKKLKKFYFNPEVTFNFVSEVEVQKIENMQSFEKQVLQSKIPVVVDVYTEHCPSCIKMLPAFNAVAKDFHKRVKLFKVDGGQASDIAQKYSIQRVPCILVFKDGKLIDRHNKAMTRKELSELIEGVLATPAAATE